MFTVLIRRVKSRREVITQAHSVEFIPGTQADPEAGLLVNHGVDAEGGYHLAPTPKGEEDWRDVFVMNTSGQTVARYTL